MSQVDYIPQEIEKKWQLKWAEDNLYASDLDKLNKYYVLAEFAFPSGDLHMGHWFTWGGADIFARFKRLQGYNVFFPNGFDAFGLPAENAAIKHNLHPKKWTIDNIERMKHQYATMGASFTFDHEVITCLPEYYKWNQWIFLKLLEKGLAYRGTSLSNWCESCQTVLANEGVEAGLCWRCGTLVVQKEVAQWFFKITDYAEKLLWNDTKKIDWPKPTKEAQNAWIGKKEGMLIEHKVKDSDITFETFTAFPAWSFADTFIVIAPDHPLVDTLVGETELERDIKDFIKENALLSQDDRLKDNFEKKGVFTGKYAIDPFSGGSMPIWVANFALMNFGTGIIRCSAHDPRDYEFAQKYNIPLKEIVERISDEPVNAHANKGVLVDSDIFTGKKIEDSIEDIITWIEEKKIGKRFINYHLHDWSISRQRYWGTPIPIIYCDDCGPVPVLETSLPVELPEDVDFAPNGKSPLAANEAWINAACPKCSKPAKRDADTMDCFVDSSWYFFRYLSPALETSIFDQKTATKIMPVDIYFGGAEHTVGHTLYSRFITKFFKDINLTNIDEYALRRINHGIVLGPDGNKMSKSKGNVVNPDDEVGRFGADAVRIFVAFFMPYEGTGPWISDRIMGPYNFLERVWRLFSKVESFEMIKEDKIHRNKAIKKVTCDIEAIKFNTAIAGLMEWSNYLGKKEKITTNEFKTFIVLLAPFAPHITEELWSMLGETESIHKSPWPIVNEEVVLDTLTLPVQVNGKVRASITIHISDSKETVKELALDHPDVKKWLEGRNPQQIMVVPLKIVSIVG